MAIEINEEEWLAKGRYKKDGKWYTSSGYEIIGASDDGGPAVVQRKTAAPQQAETAEDPALTGSYDYYEAVLRREKQRAQTLALQKEAGEAAIRLLEEKRAAAALDADRAVRQAYISHMLAKKDLAQQLSANGYSGGMTDSAYLRLLTNYENRRSELLAERQKQLGDYDRQIEDERLSLQRDLAAARQKADDAAEQDRREAYRLTAAAQQAAQEEAQAAQAARTGLGTASRSKSGGAAKTTGASGAAAQELLLPEAGQKTRAGQTKFTESVFKKYLQKEKKQAEELLGSYKTNQAQTRTAKKAAEGKFSLDT